ncbi:MAG TPA: FAD-dependent oxidoreductase, partial [Ramlibacter sp.]|nr:FAD-dependent oxidoreductase [Ramlibacter sp.]
QQCRMLLPPGEEWLGTGTLEDRSSSPHGLPVEVPADQRPWSRIADPWQLAQAGLPRVTPGIWHEQAAWIKPAALVRAWLAHPGVVRQGSTTVARLSRVPDGWELADAAGAVVARADLVVLAAAHGTASLIGDALPLQPVRGQVSWGPQSLGQALPPFPVHGNGHFIPGVPLPDGTAWYCGSTYERGDTDRSERAQDHDANLAKLSALLPAIAQELAPWFADGSVRAWTGVRCASGDRRPFLGEIQPGLWVSTAMGSRGLTFAALCAELLAARLHAEPLPLERRLAQALDTERSRR